MFADAAEVLTGHVGIDIEDRLDVVVVDDLGGDAALGGGEVREELGGILRLRAGIAIGHGAWLGLAPTEASVGFPSPGVLELKLASGAEMGVRMSASSELILLCGVCTVTLYLTPLTQLSHWVGAIWPLPLSEIKRLFETSRSVIPTWPALARSTLRRISG